MISHRLRPNLGLNPYLNWDCGRELTAVISNCSQNSDCGFILVYTYGGLNTGKVKLIFACGTKTNGIVAKYAQSLLHYKQAKFWI